ncbi:MAG: PepSY domain-containing protein, partial [Roseiarcus sp.]
MRPVFVWLHRYVGLAVAAFLLIEGLTGALLAFNADLSRALDPRF